jgi:signal transduction histidine kinase
VPAVLSSAEIVVQPLTVRRAFLQFLASVVVVVLLVGGVGVLLLHRAATHEALADARNETSFVGEGVVAPVLQASGGRVDDAVRRRLGSLFERGALGERVSHVKLWSPDGRVLYASEPQLTGRRFSLGAAEREVLRDGGSEAGVSDLTEPENAFERSEGELLEVYSGFSAAGRRFMFETYRPYQLIAANEHRLRGAFAPALIAAVLLLVALVLPLVLGLARRLERGRREREALLQRALDASDRERVRVARELHDGPVQRLSGVAFSLAAVERAPAGTDLRDAVRAGAQQVRETVRELRGTLTDLYPPNLHRQGLRPALSDTLAPLRAAGVRATLDAPEDLDVSAEAEAVLFRVAQEGTRNALEHAGASSVAIELRVADGRASLTVTDDGNGFEATQREGHFGLRLLDDLARDHEGSLEVESSPGAGTRLRVEVPA